MTLPKNELVSLVAVADEKSEFRGWTGDVGMIYEGTTNDTAIVVYAYSAVAFTANFSPSAIWTGSGENAFWSTSGNWADASNLGEGSSILFEGNTQVSNENDAVSVLRKISFGADAAAHTLVGRPVTLEEGVVNESAAVQTIGLPVTVEAGVLAVSGGGTTVFSKPLAAVGWNLSDGGVLRLDGGIDTDGADLLSAGDGTVSLKESSEAGTLYLKGRGDVNVEEGASIRLAGIVSQSDSVRLTVDGGTIAVNGAGQTYSSFTTAENLVAGPKGVVFDTGDNMVKAATTFTNDGAAPFTKTGCGTLEIPAEPAGAVAVEEGTLVLANPHLLHRWSFNGDLKDSVGGTTAIIDGTSTWNDDSHPTAITLPGGDKGTGAINLGANMLPADGSPVTIEIWATQHEVLRYSRMFDIGSDTSNWFTLEWNFAGEVAKDSVEVMKGNNKLLTVQGALGGFPTNIEWHVSVTVVKRSDGKSDIRWMRRDARTGVLVKAGSGTTKAAWSVADVAANALWLGHSQYGDKDPHATYNEVRVWKARLSDAQLSRNARLGPDRLPIASAYEFGSVDVAADATLELKAVDVTVGSFIGVGRVAGSGCLVTDTLSIGGDDAATLTLDGHLAVAGTWLIDGLDAITGTGTLDISGATISLASDTRNSRRIVLATVGEVIGWETVNIPRGRILEYADGTLVLRAQETIIYIR